MSDAPAPGPVGAQCRQCGAAAVGRFALPLGCVVYPGDREQDLCEHHVRRATPLGGYGSALIADYTVGGAFGRAWGVSASDPLRDAARRLAEAVERDEADFGTMHFPATRARLVAVARSTPLPALALDAADRIERLERWRREVVRTWNTWMYSLDNEDGTRAQIRLDELMAEANEEIDEASDPTPAGGP